MRLAQFADHRAQLRVPLVEQRDRLALFLALVLTPRA